jgi:hypothetical protein
MNVKRACHFLAAAVSLASCGRSAQVTRVAIGWQGHIGDVVGACRLAEPEERSILRSVPASAFRRGPEALNPRPGWEAVRAGAARFECDGTKTARVVEASAVVRLVIHGPHRLKVGEPGAFRVTGYDADGHELDLGPRYEWSCDGAIASPPMPVGNENVLGSTLAVLVGQEVAGVRPGKGWLHVSFGQIKQSLEITVGDER